MASRARAQAYGNSDSDYDDTDSSDQEVEEDEYEEIVQEIDGEVVKWRAKVAKIDGSIRKPVKIVASRYKKGEEVYILRPQNPPQTRIEGPFIVVEPLKGDKYKLKIKATGVMYAKEVDGNDLRVKN